MSKFSTYFSHRARVHSTPLRTSNSSTLTLELHYRGSLLMISLLAQWVVSADFARARVCRLLSSAFFHIYLTRLVVVARSD